MSSNAKTGSASKIKMESLDDLFGGSSAQEINRGRTDYQCPVSRPL